MLVIKQLEQAAELTDDNFYCQVKQEAFERLHSIEMKGGWEELGKDALYYLPEKCWGLLFYANIGADGKVYTCSGSWYDEEDCYGSLKEKTLREIWESDRFRAVFEQRSRTAHHLCFTQCHNIPMNSFLMDLKDTKSIPEVPEDLPQHINFI